MNHKELEQLIIRLTLVMLFLTACGTSTSTPAATPIPPTATSIPPTVTPIPCPTLAPVAGASEKLLPFRAIARDRVSFQLADYVVPKATEDTLLVVYFEGFQETGVSVQDMDWLLQDAECNTFEPIGFGIPVSEEPIVMMGTLGNGNVYPVANGSNPLLALVFVVSRETAAAATLLGPQRHEHRLSISSDWVPEPENVLLTLEADGRIAWESEGDNWVREQ